MSTSTQLQDPQPGSNFVKLLGGIVTIIAIVLGYLYVGDGPGKWITTSQATGIILGTFVGSIISLVIYVITELFTDLANATGGLSSTYSTTVDVLQQSKLN